MRKLSVILLLTLILISFGNEVRAQISNAAVLFLRIAAGARAAGMGEAFVAVADDATATHWNPAGLGLYPLNSKWFDVTIPEYLKPYKKVAIFEGDGSSEDLGRFDIWILSGDSLVRYSKGSWNQYDIISTRADQNLESVLRQYTGLIGLSGDNIIPDLQSRVATINNGLPESMIDSLRELIMGNLDENYGERDDLDSAFAALKDGYNQLYVDWPKFREAQDLGRKAVKDSSINEIEADRILFLLEKANWRYLPPEIKVPFEINFGGAGINDIEADNQFLWVASDSGLYGYWNKTWRRHGLRDGLLSEKINGLEISGDKVCLFTDSGLAIYEWGSIMQYGPDQGLPNGVVSAIDFDTKNSAWAVVDKDLYRFDGTRWRNYVETTDSAGGDAAYYYQFMAIYGTETEKLKYIEKFNQLNGLNEDTTKEDSAQVPMTVDSVNAMLDSMSVLGAVSKINEKSEPVQQTATASSSMIKIPFTAGFEFGVNDMAVDEYKTIWVGTDFGALNFNGKQWRSPGYKDVAATDTGQTIYDIALKRVSGDQKKAERLAEIIRTVNQLDNDTLTMGQTVKVYSNPAGSKIHDIDIMGSSVYFVTTSGTIIYDGEWKWLHEKNLGRQTASQVKEKDGSLLLVTEDKASIKAGVKMKLTMMHVNWLPELADDIYYEFLGGVLSVPGWGGIGGNITFLSYGNIKRTDAQGNPLGDFSAYDVAMTLSYGSRISSNLSAGMSAKIIYSHLSNIGAGRELGSGTSTGMAIDLGLLYRITPRLTMGMAVTNLGPEISYIDVSQSDPLPRNLGVGIAWKIIQTSYNELLFTVETNKSLAERDKSILEDFRDIAASPQTELKGLAFNPITIGGFSRDFKNAIINGGIEYQYGSFIAFRGGYIYDEVGDVKTPTLGVGISARGFKFDFAYIPSSDEVPLANTMRFSLSAEF